MGCAITSLGWKFCKNLNFAVNFDELEKKGLVFL